MKYPKITVLMSVYNDERYLKKSVDTILNQTFTDFEFIIINDGSTDSTLDILKMYSDPRIRIITNAEQIGLSKSLNKGLLLAKGEYIARQDGNDISSSKRLKKQFDFLEARPDLGLVGTWSYIIDAENRIIDKHAVFTEHNAIVTMLLTENQFVHSSVMFRKDCIDKLGGYNEELRYAQDYDMWLRTSEYFKLANIGEFLHYWRYVKQGISSDKREEQKRYAFLIRDKFLQRVVKKKEWRPIIQNAYEKTYDTTLKKYLKEVIYSQVTESINKKDRGDIRITAIISAFNEEDIIGHILSSYIRQGIQVYFIDHHSTDGTLEIAKTFLGKGVQKIETFPEECGYSSDLKDVYAWRYILKRKEELHSILNADWYMHMDADAIVESPWENITFPEAIKLVDTLGYNCVNFELFNFKPVNTEYKNNTNPQDFFEYWEPADVFDVLQVKCWKNTSQQIDLATSGGHDVQFEGKKVFPLKFIMRHYPIRSRAHGIKKVFSDRMPRFDTTEKNMDWHRQYDRYIDEKDMTFDKADFLKYDKHIVRNIYLPLIDSLNENMAIIEKEQQIQEMSRQMKSILASPAWKVGRFATAPWRWLKALLTKGPFSYMSGRPSV
jgi:glycosyltransferase involved in cell wall biosynthesis